MLVRLVYKKGDVHIPHKRGNIGRKRELCRRKTPVGIKPVAATFLLNTGMFVITDDLMFVTAVRRWRPRSREDRCSQRHVGDM